MLVDLDSLERAQVGPAEATEVQLGVVEQHSEEPPLEKAYVEEDPEYVGPASSLSAEEQKQADMNLLEVFNFYSRKFASVRGDFEQLTQNLVVLGLQGYTRFCRDFGVGLSTGEVTLVWKKSSLNHQPL